jgi:hypothetical protein
VRDLLFGSAPQANRLSRAKSHVNSKRIRFLPPRRTRERPPRDQDHVTSTQADVIPSPAPIDTTPGVSPGIQPTAPHAPNDTTTSTIIPGHPSRAIPNKTSVTQTRADVIPSEVVRELKKDPLFAAATHALTAPARSGPRYLNTSGCHPERSRGICFLPRQRTRTALRPNEKSKTRRPARTAFGSNDNRRAPGMS